MLNPQVIRQQIENLKLTNPDVFEDEEAWALTLESETDFNALLTSIVRRIEDTKAIASGTGERLQELAARKLRFEHRMDSLRTLLFKLMESAELTKCELPEATISLRNGPPQLIGDADPDDVCDVYCKVSRTLDRTAIKAALKDGVIVPGFQLSNSKPSLTIRIK